ncbi:MAG TPA: TIGR04282 family arsenosugar biosynthesis glycosyltransferase [Candidatus Acidoferrum sp.]|nr:TIGR04282 family arsenosugar biosynthesis glycosyltransferase [Candidatus Acidoferrum sp.]
MTLSNRTLVIMAKAPRLGSVKTRLAKSLSLQAAGELYRCFLADTIALAQALDGVEVAIMCPETDVEDLARAAGGAVGVVPQIGNGLAAGLTSVFAHFAGTGQSHIVAFNSDSPHLPVAVLESAFNALAKYDVVIGPTEDGGYYLVGATASHPGLFTGDVMGTTSAFETLLARAREKRLSVHLTEPFYDIDEAADLGRLAAELERTPGKAPKTAEWLLAWKSAVPQTVQNGRVE